MLRCLIGDFASALTSMSALIIGFTILAPAAIVTCRPFLAAVFAPFSASFAAFFDRSAAFQFCAWRSTRMACTDKCVPSVLVLETSSSPASERSMPQQQPLGQQKKKRRTVCACTNISVSRQQTTYHRRRRQAPLRRLRCSWT